MIKTKPKFPDVKVKLTGYDGNAFTIMGRASKAMRDAGCTKEEIDEYRDLSMSGDYDNLLRVAMQTVNVT